VSTSRKYQNLIDNPSIAFVIGWDDEQTIQYEGIAKIPTAEELDKLLEIYFKVFPTESNGKKPGRTLLISALVQNGYDIQISPIRKLKNLIFNNRNYLRSVMSPFRLKWVPLINSTSAT
jgi:hypothetical protein